MNGGRALIVNADDFGQSAGINRGVIRSHERGIVTSASLMVRWPGAEEAAAYARDHPELSVGLHLDLGEWYYADRQWQPRYEVVDTADAGAVELEIRRQVESCRRLLGRVPSHLDSHQHVHRQQPVRAVLRQVGRELGIPVRDVSGGAQYLGDFYGQDGRGWPVPDAITVEALTGVLTRLPAGVTELGCHPGEQEDLPSTYCRERPIEVETLCDPRVRATLESLAIRLCSFLDAPLPGR